jgi:hypothetical protein
MTEESFKSIKFLQMEIERCDRVLKDLRHWKGSEKYAEVLANTRSCLIEKKAVIEDIINGITDDEIRLIFKLKFIDLRSWNYIANKLHYDRTTVYKKYKRYLKGLTDE